MIDSNLQPARGDAEGGWKWLGVFLGVVLPVVLFLLPEVGPRLRFGFFLPFAPIAVAVVLLIGRRAQQFALGLLIGSGIVLVVGTVGCFALIALVARGYA